ncbi:uncharacterized protein P174DRAFT_4748 [Aspergillus novofumigatus IBT 16806]|uniref:Secreted protein n=1 Tax=Aspergillus novofumigatus (strain IBT 16806) TaxID=1392255 RepID=A0A2I1CKH6_ASPN1|nr:uncharacterized protein P174DRAFT_4748 [Aspergillus novofumigatus IBT 16806]PKX98129.1 hypothetical protein P174DRAFT_4748 [Aspergillus novofumigatus IBT 16806]
MIIVICFLFIIYYPAYASMDNENMEVILVGVSSGQGVPNSTGTQSKVCRTKNGRSQSVPESRSVVSCAIFWSLGGNGCL